MVSKERNEVLLCGNRDETLILFGHPPQFAWWTAGATRFREAGAAPQNRTTLGVGGTGPMLAADEMAHRPALEAYRNKAVSAQKVFRVSN
jgi:hypothetical protein